MATFREFTTAHVIALRAASVQVLKSLDRVVAKNDEETATLAKLREPVADLLNKIDRRVERLGPKELVTIKMVGGFFANPKRGVLPQKVARPLKELTMMVDELWENKFKIVPGQQRMK